MVLESGRVLPIGSLQDIAEMYEKEENAEQAMEWFGKAADFYASENANTSVNQMKLKVAEYARLERRVSPRDQTLPVALNPELAFFVTQGWGIVTSCEGVECDAPSAVTASRYQQTGMGGCVYMLLCGSYKAGD